MFLLRLSLFLLISMACHASLLGFYGLSEREVKIERAAGGAAIELGDPFDAVASIASQAAAPEHLVEPEPLQEPELEELQTEEPLEPNPEALLPLPQAPQDIAEVQEIKEVANDVKHTEPKPEKDLLKDKERRHATDEVQARKKGATEKSDAAQTAKQIGNDGEQTDVSGLKEMSNYRGKVYAKLRKHRLNWRAGRGRAIIQFRIQNDGTLSALTIEKTSGRSKFDKALIKLVEAAAPFPRFPKGLYATSISFSVPFGFK